MKQNNLLQDVVRTAGKLLAKRVPYDPKNHYLETIFAPIQGEYTATELKVTGRIPAALSGILARIGPNPKKSITLVITHGLSATVWCMVCESKTDRPFGIGIATLQILGLIAR